jgi:hypothetical protein
VAFNFGERGIIKGGLLCIPKYKDEAKIFVPVSSQNLDFTYFCYYHFCVLGVQSSTDWWVVLLVLVMFLTISIWTIFYAPATKSRGAY